MRPGLPIRRWKPIFAPVGCGHPPASAPQMESLLPAEGKRVAESAEVTIESTEDARVVAADVGQLIVNAVGEKDESAVHP